MPTPKLPEHDGLWQLPDDTEVPTAQDWVWPLIIVVAAILVGIVVANWEAIVG